MLCHFAKLPRPFWAQVTVRESACTFSGVFGGRGRVLCLPVLPLSFWAPGPLVPARLWPWHHDPAIFLCSCSTGSPSETQGGTLPCRRPGPRLCCHPGHRLGTPLPKDVLSIPTPLSPVTNDLVTSFLFTFCSSGPEALSLDWKVWRGRRRGGNRKSDFHRAPFALGKPHPPWDLAQAELHPRLGQNSPLPLLCFGGTGEIPPAKSERGCRFWPDTIKPNTNKKAGCVWGRGSSLSLATQSAFWCLNLDQGARLGLFWSSVWIDALEACEKNPSWLVFTLAKLNLICACSGTFFQLLVVRGSRAMDVTRQNVDEPQ